MKGKKKILVTVLCMALIAVGAMAGTMAYFTDKDAVINTFTVGQVEIELDEAKVTADGVPADGADRVKENTYHLIPGTTYTKDPIVHVDDDSSDCYIYVTVNNQIAEIEGETTVAAQMEELGWKEIAELDGLPVYVFGEKPVSGGTDVPVFETFTVDGNKANNTLLAEHSQKAIVVTAYAVQGAGFGSGLEAWNTTFGA